MYEADLATILLLVLPYEADCAANLPFILLYEVDRVAILLHILKYDADSAAILLHVTKHAYVIIVILQPACWLYVALPPNLSVLFHFHLLLLHSAIFRKHILNKNADEEHLETTEKIQILYSS